MMLTLISRKNQTNNLLYFPCLSLETMQFFPPKAFPDAMAKNGD
jgi:hypothetical protein